MKTINYLTHHARNGQSGYTLLELLIAMSLGLFLVTALLQVLLGNRVAFRVQEDLSRVQEDGRFAIAVINKTISMTGYREDATTDMASQFSAYTTPSSPSVPPPISFSSGESISGTDDNPGGSSDGVLDGSNTIALRYRGATDNSTRDCLDRVISSGFIATNRFYINDDNTLSCRSDIFDPGTGTNNTLTRPLIDNVEDMQIRYGMNTDGAVSSNVTAHCYLNAGTTLGSGNDCTTLNYGRVVSARISMLLKSENDRLTPDGSFQTYAFDDNTVTASDNYLYRVITTTVAIRNSIL